MLAQEPQNIIKLGDFFCQPGWARGQPTSPPCSHVWRMNSCWLQSSTRHNEKFPVGSVSLPQSRYIIPATGWLQLGSSLSWKYQTFSQKTPPALGGRGRGLRGKRTFLNPKIFSFRPTGNISAVIWVIIEQSDPVAAVKC